MVGKQGKGRRKEGREGGTGGGNEGVKERRGDNVRKKEGKA